MERIFIQENNKRFSKLNNNPPMTELIKSNLGVLVEENMIEEVLEGEYKPEKCNEYTK